MTFKGFTITDAEVEKLDTSSHLHLRLLPTKGREPEYRSICLDNASNHLAQAEGQSELGQLVRAVGIHTVLTDSSEFEGKKVRMRRQGWRVEWMPFSDDTMAFEFFSRRDAKAA